MMNKEMVEIPRRFSLRTLCKDTFVFFFFNVSCFEKSAETQKQRIDTLFGCMKPGEKPPSSQALTVTAGAVVKRPTSCPARHHRRERFAPTRMFLHSVRSRSSTSFLRYALWEAFILTMK